MLSIQKCSQQHEGYVVYQYYYHLVSRLKHDFQGIIELVLFEEQERDQKVTDRNVHHFFPSCMYHYVSDFEQKQTQFGQGCQMPLVPHQDLAVVAR